MMNRVFQLFFKHPSYLPKMSAKLPLFSQPSFHFASLKDKMEQRNMKKSAEEFKKEIEFLANKPTYTLVDFKQRVVDGLNKLQKGLKAKLLSGNEQTEANLTNQKKILNAFYDEELVDEKTLTPTSKKDISVVAQTTVADVNMLLKNYEYMKGIHTWLRALKERNEPLPENEEELTYLFRRDRPIRKSEMLKGYRDPLWSKRRIRQRVKWGPKKRV